MANLLIDTGSKITLLKKDIADGNALCYTNQKAHISGITNEVISTLGICYSEFNLNGKIITHPVHLVSESFPISYDGILGIDFLSKYKANIDYEKKTLSFKYENSPIVWQIIPKSEENVFILPARSESIQKYTIANTKSYLVCLSSEIQNGVYVGNTIVDCTKNRSVYIPVINTTDKQLVIKNPSLKFEDLSFYDVCPVSNASQTSNAETSHVLQRINKLKEVLPLNHMTPDQKKEILQICTEFNHIFFLEGDSLTYANNVTYSIPTYDNDPIHVKPYRLPYHQQTEINRQVEDMFQQGIISKSTSPYNSPLLIVPKKADNEGNRKWRVVVDFRTLNDKTIGDAHPLPNISEILDQLGNSKYFTSLDLASGYHQIKLSDKDKEKTAFSTADGHWQFERLCFGLKGAPAVFQRMMNSVLTGLQGTKCFVYLDDIIIYGKTFSEHNNKLKDVFQRLSEYNLKLQPIKCQFLRTELQYLGHVISENGTCPDPSKVSSVKDFPTPKSAKHIKSFLGLAGYYRRYIKNFAEIAQPLTQLLKKDAIFKWTPNCTESFELLKNSLISAPILQFPDFQKEFILTTDASGKAIGAVLSQGSLGKDLPIAYASRILNKAEQNYSTIERELLSVCWGVKHFRPYLFGKRFTIVTDHKPLIWLFSVKDPGSRLIKFRIKLEEYDYTIIHKPGKFNSNADALSRIYYNADNDLSSYHTFCDATKRRLVINKNVIEDKHDISKADNAVFFFSQPNKLNHLNTNLENRSVNKPFIISHDSRRYILVKTHEQSSIINEEDLFLSVVCLKHFCMQQSLTSISVDNITMHESYKHLSYEMFRLMFRYIFSDTNVQITMYTNQITSVSSETDIQKIIHQYHATPSGGHKGIQKTYKKIKADFHFPHMYKRIKQFVQTCDCCQRNKTSKLTKMPLTITTTARKPFEKVFLDIQGPLPVTELRNRYILTFEDDLTRYCLAVPIENQEAVTVARAFVTNIVCHYGIPACVLTDCGSNFTSELFSNVCKLLQIKKLTTTAFHPQSNGSIERSHRNITEFLRNFINKDQNNWDIWLPYAIFTYNTSEHEATRHTPFELLFGYKANIPTSAQRKPEVVYNYDDYSNELKSRLQHCHEIARESLISNKHKAKTFYDKRINPLSIVEGDKVLLRNERNIPGRNKKLESIYMGPYEVIQIKNPTNTVIKVGKKLVTVHNNRLKLFHN